MPAAGIYIHIPFCTSKCNYCDFYSVEGREDVWSRFVTALEKEIDRCAVATRQWRFDSLYFGGGTPSLCDPRDMQRVLVALHQKYDLSGLREITLEAVPGEAPPERLAAFQALGCNRLSLEVCSLEPELLQFLTRNHRPKDVFDTYRDARQAGFENINCDLLFAIPGQTRSIWRRDLKAMVALEPEHISCYALTVEAGTPLQELVHRQAVELPADDLAAALYNDAREILTAAGYSQYEVTSYSRPGSECRHNRHYWRIHPCLAFGPSAHGFDGRRRWRNSADLDHYLEQIEKGETAVAETAEVSELDLTNELIGCGLLIREGIDLERIPPRYRPALRRSIQRNRDRWGSYLAPGENRLALTVEGFAWADAIAADLLLEEGIPSVRADPVFRPRTR